MVIDIETEVNNLLERIKKDVPEKPSKNFEEALNYHSSRENLYQITYHFWSVNIFYGSNDEQDIRLERLGKEFNEMVDGIENERYDFLDEELGRQRCHLEEVLYRFILPPLEALHSVLITYLREHNVQKDAPLWKVNETLKRCICYAWAIFEGGNPSDWPLFMRQLTDIEDVCKRILPAIEEDARIADLYELMKDNSRKLDSVQKDTTTLVNRRPPTRSVDAAREKLYREIERILKTKDSAKKGKYRDGKKVFKNRMEVALYVIKRAAELTSGALSEATLCKDGEEEGVRQLLDAFDRWRKKKSK